MCEKRKTDFEKNEDKFFTLLYPNINTILEKFGFEHKIVKPLPNIIVTYEGKKRECDFVGLLDNGDILNVEAHSTPITLEDKKKFFDYASYYSITNQGKNRKVHTLVLSSYYTNNDSVNYEWHGTSPFTIPYKSFNSFDGEKTINTISLKNKNNEKLNDSEIGDLRILTFMKSRKSHKELLIESIKLTNEAIMDEEERIFTKCLQYFLAKKFIQDDHEFEEVMEMMEIGSAKFGGVFDRYDEIMREKMKNERKDEINLIMEEIEKRGMSKKDIEEIKKLIE